jgi:glycosyltransferase involved in cell wall biosynthesis
LKFGAIYCLYDDHEYLDISLLPVLGLDKVLFLISDVPWNGSPSDNTGTINKVKELCEKHQNFELIQGHWTNEIDQRNFGLEQFFKAGIDYAFIIDSDEIYHGHHFRNIVQFILQNPQYDAYHVEWNTLWKKSYHVIVPREPYKPLIAVRVSHFQFTIIRGGFTSVIRTPAGVMKTQASSYNAALIPTDTAICYHLSYARDDGYMKRKLETNSHAKEFIPNWYESIWKKWTPSMQNLHPVTPTDYRIAIKSEFTKFPDQLKVFIKKEKTRKCSIIILNWNSLGLLKRCLSLVDKNTPGPHNIIIVDNGSRDGSVDYITNLPDVKMVLNKENKGFPAGVNQGIKLADPDSDICLLNVDAEVQEGWLEEMYRTLNSIPDAGMVGPLGNEVASGHQRAGYVDRDCRTPNLYGFCLLIYRELIDKIGYFDESYGLGGWEDNDYCIRAKLAGYDLYIASKSLVVHKAHQVYRLNGMNHLEKDTENRERYLNKFYGILLEYGKLYDMYQAEDMAVKTGLYIKG